MEKVIAYKLDNGELIEDINVALKKEIDIKCGREIELLCDNLMTYNLRAEDIADIIKENRELFLKACSGGVL